MVPRERYQKDQGGRRWARRKVRNEERQEVARQQGSLLCQHPELRLQQGSQRWLLGIYTFSSSKQTCKTSTTTPILQVRKLRLGEMTCLVQGSRAQAPAP